MSLAHEKSVTVNGLFDSGATGSGFIDQAFVKSHGISTRATPSARPLLLGNGEVADTITEYAVVPMTVAVHSETALLYVAKVESPVIFGLRWLQRHNPHINWEKMTLTFGSSYCRSQCLPRDTPFPPQAPVVPDTQKSVKMLNHADAVDHCRTPVTAAPSEDSPRHPTPHVTYRPPTVEDAPENGDDAISIDSAVDMTFEQTLTPGATITAYIGKAACQLPKAAPA